MQKIFQVGSKTFVLDQDKAEAAFAAKKVINGRETMCFNLLPLKYQWAYDLYRKMKANHWEPEDIPMGKDIEQWRDEKTVTEVERWIIRMGIGYFSAAEGIVGDNIQHVVRELVTAPELKLVLEPLPGSPATPQVCEACHRHLSGQAAGFFRHTVGGDPRHLRYLVLCQDTARCASHAPPGRLREILLRGILS